MNEEIKEIIEYLKDEDIYVDDCDYSYKLLSLDENKALLNYITNLQEENEKQHKGFLEVCEEAKDLEKRIDKAVEYIINHTQSTAHLEMDTKSTKDLLDILRGDE